MRSLSKATFKVLFLSRQILEIWIKGFVSLRIPSLHYLVRGRSESGWGKPRSDPPSSSLEVRRHFTSELTKIGSKLRFWGKIGKYGRFFQSFVRHPSSLWGSSQPYPEKFRSFTSAVWHSVEYLTLLLFELVGGATVNFSWNKCNAANEFR